jgi:pimeloyl-ACP methyl ester carboxylesterase
LFVLLTVAGPTEVPPVAADEHAPQHVESGFVEVEGGRIFYEAAGSGPALIMIHDGLLHHETWNAQFYVFAKTHRVVRWDRRGYGRSDPPEARYSNRDDLLALMKALDLERATLVGCSYGGLLSLEFALDHPERVSSLVLVGPIASGFDFSEHFRTRGGRGVPGFDEPLRRRIEYWASEDPWIMDPGSSEARRTFRHLLMENPQNLAGHSRFALPPPEPVAARLPLLGLPTLLVVGEADIPDVHSHVGAIEAGIVGSKRVVIAHAGHLVHMERPDLFNETVAAFLDGSD